MNYPAQSNLWRLDMVTRPKTNGKTVNSNGQSRMLARSRQIFPLSLFPDEIIVEELRIVWIRKMGPWAEEIVSIMTTDIASVNCASGLLFGYIHIKSLTGGPEILVDDLHKRDVYKIMSLIEGIAMSAREGLVVEGSNLDEERDHLLAAGHVN